MSLGFNSTGDVLTRTQDGVDLNDVWKEFQETIIQYNARRDKLVELLTYDVKNNIETILTGTGSEFEEASEFGVPKSVRTTGTVQQMGFEFKWYDTATRFTWQFLSKAYQSQVDAIHNEVIAADNRLVFNKVMSAIFNDKNRMATIDGNNYNVYALYNGDGTVPPPRGPHKFDGTYTHYLSSGANQLDSGDLEEIMNRFNNLGFGLGSGTTQVLLVNTQEANAIRSFKRNEVNANTAKALYDFIPSATQAPMLLTTPAGLLGTQPPNEFEGLPVIGSYGTLLIVQEDYIPAGYVLAFVTGGTASSQNVVGFRQHPNSELQGLRLIAQQGASNYPLINSYYVRGFGTGIRHRGNALVMQVTDQAKYQAPAQYSA